jgi:hypothetical protein
VLSPLKQQKKKLMNQENAYRHTRDIPTPRGTEWPRVSSRIAAGYPQQAPTPAGWGATTRDAHSLVYRQPHLQPQQQQQPQPQTTPLGRNRQSTRGGSYRGGEPLQRRIPAPIMDDDYAEWSDDLMTQPAVATRGIEALQRRQAEQTVRHSERRDEMMGEMQARFNDYAQANDFQVFNSAVPPAGPEALNSTQLQALNNRKEDPRAAFDPTVPSYVQPSFEPEQPPAESQEAVHEDEEAGKPERGAVALRHQDGQSDAERVYPMVYQDAPFLQLPQSNLIVNPVPSYLTIDSRDRDRTVWLNSNCYRIPLVSSDNTPHVKTPGKRYKNIYSISLLSAVIPKAMGVLDEPYLLMQIDEIDNMYDSANPACSRAFTKLYFKEVWPGGKYLRLDKGVGDPLTKIYWPAPRASLDSITISFRRYDGTLFDFGPDSSPPADPLSDRQTSITLEIRTFVTDAGKALGHRNS